VIEVVSSWQNVRRLALVLAIVAIASAVLTIMFTFGLPPLPPPPPDIPDLVARIEAYRLGDQKLFPFAFLQGVVTMGLFLVAALLGAALRAWARPSGLRDAMVLLFVVGGSLGIAASVLNVAVADAAQSGICDCSYKTEELIGQDYALGLGWTVVNWLQIAAVTLVAIGVAAAGRLVFISSMWRTLSYAIAVLALLAVLIRALAAFVFIEAFDPFQVSDLLIALAAGILVPIWAILLARGAPPQTATTEAVAA
jgi:hypothetical protein